MYYNGDATYYFVNEIYSLVKHKFKEKHPNEKPPRLIIVGFQPPPVIRNLRISDISVYGNAPQETVEAFYKSIYCAAPVRCWDYVETK